LIESPDSMLQIDVDLSVGRARCTKVFVRKDETPFVKCK
jgi:hypothetical protein